MEIRQTQATVQQIQQVNVGYPERMIEGKMLISAAFIQKKIPSAENWCETLNAGGNLWPVTPTNTVFALNSKVAGLSLVRVVSRDTVVFFEADSPGWNQVGGPELLSKAPAGVAVAFMDGRSIIVPQANVSNLRWTP